jgi:DNA-binding CsgD family transcriptional regulator
MDYRNAKNRHEAAMNGLWNLMLSVFATLAKFEPYPVLSPDEASPWLPDVDIVPARPNRFRRAADWPLPRVLPPLFTQDVATEQQMKERAGLIEWRFNPVVVEWCQQFGSYVTDTGRRQFQPNLRKPKKAAHSPATEFSVAVMKQVSLDDVLENDLRMATRPTAHSEFEAQEALRRRYYALTERQREAQELRDQGDTLNQIARRLGIGRDAVKERLKLADQKLKKLEDTK